MLIPLNTGAHWSLAVVDNTNREIRYYDSLSGDNMKCLQRIRFAPCFHIIANYYNINRDYINAQTSKQQWKLICPKVIVISLQLFFIVSYIEHSSTTKWKRLWCICVYGKQALPQKVITVIMTVFHCSMHATRPSLRLVL